MTDNEIIKALENEIRSTEYVDSDYCDGVDLTLIESAIDIINRQKAEIERLRKEVNLVSIQFQDVQERYEEAQTEVEQWKEEANKYQKLWCIAVDDIETAKAEAYKEFAEKLNAKCDGMIKDKWNSNVAPISWAEAYADFKDDIDNLVKNGG